MSDEKVFRFLVVTEKYDEKHGWDLMVRLVLNFATKGILGPCSPSENRWDYGVETILEKLGNSNFVVVVLDDLHEQPWLEVGPKCAAAILGAQERKIPYVVLVPFARYEPLTKNARWILEPAASQPEMRDDTFDEAVDVFMYEMRSPLEAGTSKLLGEIPLRNLTCSLDYLAAKVVAAVCAPETPESPPAEC